MQGSCSEAEDLNLRETGPFHGTARSVEVVLAHFLHVSYGGKVQWRIDVIIASRTFRGYDLLKNDYIC
jgi:agmatine/peptidylarginine deiminase